MATKVAELSIVIRARNAAKKALTGVRSQLDRVKKAVFNLSSAFAALGISLVFRGVIDATIKMERINNTLKSVTGSSEAARKEFEFISAEANRLGLDLSVTALEYAKLTAASKGTTLQGQKTRDIFVAVTEAGTVLGLSAAQQAGALTAVQQIMSKGVVSAEELRGQLGERLPGAFQIAARAMGLTTRELGKMLEQGKLASDVFLPKFAAELKKTFGPQVAEAVTSLNAKINRMNTGFFNLNIAIGKAGLIEFISNATEKITELLPKIEGFIQLVSSIFAQIGSVFSGLIGLVQLLISGFFGLSAAVGSVTDALGVTEGQFEKFKQKSVDAFEGYQAAIKPLSDSFRELLSLDVDGKTKAVAEEMGKAAQATNQVDDATMKLVASSDQLVNSSEKVKEAVKTEADEYAKLAEELKGLNGLQSGLSAGNSSLADRLIEFNEQLQQGKNITQSLRNPLEKYQDDLANLNKLLSTGAINQETFNRAIRSAKDAYRSASKAASDFRNSSSQSSSGGVSDLFSRFPSRFPVQNNPTTSLGFHLQRLEDARGPTASERAAQSKIPSFAKGIKFVPRDMTADIHQGERVLTAKENRDLGSGNLGGQTVSFGDINIQIANSTEAPEETARRIHEELRRIDERRRN